MFSQNNSNSERADSTSKQLMTLEKEGIMAVQRGDYTSAIHLFSKVLELSPDYEHGMIHYNLACAFEDSGEIDAAETHYLKALEFYPDDPVRLGGLASFMYLHRKPADAFDAYFRLLKLQLEQGLTQSAEKSVMALMTLGEKLGWSKEEMSGRIEELKSKVSGPIKVTPVGREKSRENKDK